jgi:hypothetical protein
MTLDELVARAAPPVQQVTIAGNVFHVRALSGTGRNAYSEFAQDKHKFDMRAVALFGLCDADGNALGDPNSEADREKVGRMDGAVMQELCNAFLRISKLTKEEQEDSEKKSAPSPSDSSGTG